MHVPVGFYGSPKARETHGVAERVNQDNGQQAPRSQEQECGVCAKQGCIGELQNRASNGSDERHPWVADAELIEMVKVSDAKYKRRKKDGPGQ